MNTDSNSAVSTAAADTSVPAAAPTATPTTVAAANTNPRPSGNRAPNKRPGGKPQPKAQELSRETRSRLFFLLRTRTPVNATVKTVATRGSDKSVSGVEVEVEGARAFIPNSELETGKTAAEHTGEIEVVVLNMHPRGIVVSRKAAVDRKEFLAALTPGSRIDGTVNSEVEYGFFLKIGPVDGLLHKQEIPEGVEVKKGDVLNVRVRGVSEGKVGLSLHAEERQRAPRRDDRGGNRGGNRRNDGGNGGGTSDGGGSFTPSSRRRVTPSLSARRAAQSPRLFASFTSAGSAAAAAPAKEDGTIRSFDALAAAWPKAAGEETATEAVVTEAPATTGAEETAAS